MGGNGIEMSAIIKFGTGARIPWYPRNAVRAVIQGRWMSRRRLFDPTMVGHARVHRGWIIFRGHGFGPGGSLPAIRHAVLTTCPREDWQEQKKAFNVELLRPGVGFRE